MSKHAVIGIDIGGSKIAANISDGNLWSVAERVVPTPDAARPDHPESSPQAGRAAMLMTLVDLCKDLLAAAPDHDAEIVGVGIGTAGQVNPHTGEIVDANENIIGWKGTPLVDHLKAALNLPVTVENDVRALALAESALGAGREYRHLLFVAVGTGIGGAIVMDNQVWQGAHFSGGEIGYLYGDTVGGQHLTIEQLYAGAAIARRYADGTLSLREIAEQAIAGYTAEQQVIQQAATALGLRIAPVLAFLDPEALIVGGGVPEIGALWWDPFVAAIGQFSLASVRQIPIVQAELGNRAGMIGAGVLAAREAGLRP